MLAQHHRLTRCKTESPNDGFTANAIQTAAINPQNPAINNGYRSTHRLSRFPFKYATTYKTAHNKAATGKVKRPQSKATVATLQNWNAIPSNWSADDFVVSTCMTVHFFQRTIW